MSRRRGIVVVLVLAQACLLPQSVDPESTRPHTVPLIDLMQLPDYWYTPRVTLYLPGSDDSQTSCHCELELTIPSIKESDPTVTLEGRWFVDYDINNPATIYVLNPQFPGAFNSTADVRGPATYSVNADTLKFTAKTTHSIEFLIAEQAGWNTDATVRPHHRSLNAGWDATVIRLIVDVQSSVAPQCDKNADVNSPPTRRICP